jgi:hypothetical protein
MDIYAPPVISGILAFVLGIGAKFPGMVNKKFHPVLSNGKK